MPSDEPLCIPGADAAILGTVWRCGQLPFVVYDYGKLVAHFVREGMSDDDALEWIEVNIKGAWVGPGTPGVVDPGIPDWLEMEE